MSHGGTDVNSVSRSRPTNNNTSTVWRVVIATLIASATHIDAFPGAVSHRAYLRRIPPTLCPKRSCNVCNQKFCTSPTLVSGVTKLQMGSAATDDGNDNLEDVLESTPSIIALPTTQQLLIYIFTTVLVWTSEPLLSIVDSATVGSYASRATYPGIPSNLASVVQLAALGPATMLCDSAIFLTYFIGLAATNKLARASAKKDWKSMIEISSHSLGVSVALGFVLLLALFLFGESLLRSIIGTGGAVFTDAVTNKSIDLTGEVVKIALGYTWIRAVAAGFAITGSTAQSLLLCVLDTRTVTLAVLVATMLNTIGDVYLVAYKGMGVLGAAIATTIATIMSNLLLISKGRSLIGQWRLALWTEKSSEGNTSLRDIKEDVESADQNDKMKEYLVLPFISLPDRESFRSLVFLAGPIFLVMMAKLIEFWCMTTGANSFGLISTACHNLLMRIFLFFAVFGDGISQASQTFLPGLFKKNRVVKKKKASKSARSKETDQVIRRLALISASLGVFISITAWWIANNAGGAFTTDNQLVSLMAKTSTYMGANLLLNPLAEMFEGVIIASGEMRYLLAARGVVMALFLTALRTSVCKITDIWKLLLVFQSIKILLGIQFCWKRKKSAEG